MELILQGWMDASVYSLWARRVHRAGMQVAMQPMGDTCWPSLFSRNTSWTHAKPHQLCTLIHRRNRPAHLAAGEWPTKRCSGWAGWRMSCSRMAGS